MNCKSLNENQIKAIAVELFSLGCPVWKIAKLLYITEQQVIRFTGINER